MWEVERPRPGVETAVPEFVPPLEEGVLEFQQAGADTALVVPTEHFLPDRLPRVVGEEPVVVEGRDEVISCRAGLPPRLAVAIYVWCPVKWGTSASH